MFTRYTPIYLLFIFAIVALGERLDNAYISLSAAPLGVVFAIILYRFTRKRK